MKKSDGFTLIEIVVAMTIFVVLTSLAVPNFTNWMRNIRVRAAAESIQSGLNLARMEALRRNTTVRFQLVDTMDSSCANSTSGPHWYVSRDSVVGKCDVEVSETTDPRIIQSRTGDEGGGRVALSSGQSIFSFDALGRLTTPPTVIAVASADVSQSCIADGGSVRCINVTVTAGGQIRMCDPVLPSTDTQAC